jgi:hypothetical protein
MSKITLPSEIHTNVITMQNFWLLNLVVSKENGRLLKINVRVRHQISYPYEIMGRILFIYLFLRIYCILIEVRKKNFLSGIVKSILPT